MNYYETKYPYYALIPARCKDDAISLYVEEIADNEDGELEDNMIEVSQIDAFIKFISGINEDGEDIKTLGKAIDEFYKAHILLIDGQLR